MKNEILFIDTTIAITPELLANIDISTTQIVFLNAQTDALLQIATALQAQQNFDAIHIISHGSRGNLNFANGSLNSENLSHYAPLLGKIGQSLSENGDILLYGCDVAKEEQGETFVNLFAKLTHADIAASNDLTGASALGGDWNLEVQSGKIETNPLALLDYQGLLAQNLINGLGGTSGFGENDYVHFDDPMQSPGIDITSVFGASGVKFGSNYYTTLFINNNGIVTFGEGTKSFTPNGLKDGVKNTGVSSPYLPTLALYWTDLDTRKISTTVSAGGTSTGANLVHWDLDTVNKKMTITWNDVAEYSSSANSIPVLAAQMVLTDAGDGNMNIEYRYEYVAELKSHTATAGWNAGIPNGVANVDYYEIPLNSQVKMVSGINVIALSDLDTRVGNSGQDGVFQFFLRNGGVINKALSYDITTFVGSGAGTVANTATLTLVGDTFSAALIGTALPASRITNLPTDVAATLTITSATTATLSFTPTLARAFSDTDDRANVTVSFINSDFTGGSATAITGATTSNLLLDFPNITPTFVGGINNGLTLLEDAGATTISNAVLKVYDPDNTDAQLTYTVKTLPTKGTLTNNGVGLAVNSTFTQADINSGLLKYTPTANKYGSDNFQFEVRDGVALSVLSNQTFNFAIAAVNDVHTGKPAFTFTAPLTSGKALAANLGTLNEIDEVLSSAESSVTIQWQVSANNTDWFDIAGATNGSYTLGSPLTPSNQQGKYIRVKLNWGNGDFAESEVSDSQAIIFTPPNLAGITAGTSIIEPIALSTTETNNATPVSVFDFTIHDGVSDSKVTTISQIVLNTSGTADFTKVSWLLTGNDITVPVTGTYSSGAQTLTFTGLNISVADTQNETYVVKAYYTNNTNLTEGQTYILSLSPNSGVTIGDATTTTQLQFTQPAVTNDSGTTVSVLATKLLFDTQPAGSNSGATLTTQPVLKATDAVGNLDTDFISSVSLTENSAGTLSGTTAKEASAGIITFSDILYTATSDHETFEITANAAGLTAAVSNTITSNVVATKLEFTAQPSPTVIESGKNTAFTTVPAVRAIDAQNVLDVDYLTAISLSVTDPVDGILDGTVNSFANATQTPVAGAATFTGLTLQYTSVSASDNLAFRATSGSLTAINSQTLTANSIPSVTAINRVNASPTNANTVDFSVTFSENVSGVDTSDFIFSTAGISGASISSISGSGANYTISVNTGSGDGTLRLDLNDDDSILSATNIRLGGTGLSNGNFSSGQTYSIDKTPPIISINTVAGDDKIDTQEDDAAIVISGSTSGAEDGQIVTMNFGGMSKTTTVSSNLWSTSLTPAEMQSFPDGTINVNAAVSDAVGNAATPASKNVSYHKDLPTCIITSSDYAISLGETATITFTFSEIVTGFTELDVTVGNGSISTPLTTDGGKTWTATYTPINDVENATNVITLDNSGVEDNAINKGVGVTNSPNYSVDTLSPTVASIERFIPSDAITNADTLTFRMTFSEAVNNVNADDFVVTGTSATISNVTTISSKIYDVTLSGGDLSSLTGTAQISFSAGQNILDNANNLLTNLLPTGTNNSVYTLDNSAATPVLTLVSDSGSSNSDAITNDGNLAVSNLEIGATWEFSIDNAATWMAGTGATFSVSGDGNKSVFARQTDSLGNISANAVLNFALDTAIVLPTLALVADSGINNDSITNNGTVTVSNLENGANWQFSEDNGVTWQTGTGNNFIVSGDGNKSVQIKQTDVAGNVSATTSLNFVLDTTIALPTLALAVDSNLNSDLITNNGTITVSNLETGASWQFSEDNGVTWQAGTGNNFVVSGDGNKTVQVKQTDVAGNASSIVSLNFVLDTAVTLPNLALALDSNLNSDLMTNNGTLIVSNLETGATWQFSEDNGATWQTGTGNNFALSGDGNKTVQVKQTDVAGNASSIVSLNFVLDTAVTLPNLALALDSNLNSDLITNNGTITVSNLESGATWQFSEDNGATWQTGTGNNFALSGDGNKTVQVKQTDVAGNVSSIVSLNFVLDTAVTLPNLALALDSNLNSDLMTNNGTVTVSNLETGATWQFSEDNGVTWQVGTGNNFAVSGDGNKTVQVKQTDVAGNASSTTSLNFVLDTTVALPNLALAVDSNINNDLITNNGTVIVSNLETGASWQFSENNGVTWQAGTGNNFAVSGDGNKTVQVKQTDVAGNVSATANLNFILDTGIATPRLSLAFDSGSNSSDKLTNNGTILVSDLEAGAKWEWSSDNTNWILGNSDRFTLTGDGNYPLFVRQTDVAGNVSSSSAFDFVLDSFVLPPVLTLVTAVENTTKTGVVAVSGIENQAIWQYSLDVGKTWLTGTDNSLTFSGDGEKTVITRQIDMAGNVSMNSAAFTFTLDTNAVMPVLSLAWDTGKNNTDRITNNGEITVSGIEKRARWEFSTDNVMWNVGYGHSFNLFGDGEKATFVHQIDAVGNISPSSLLTFILDTQVEFPVLALVNDTGTKGDSLTSDGTVFISNLENGASWQYSLNNGKSWSAGSGDRFTLSGDGNKAVLVKQTDLAGNSNQAAFNFILDNEITPILLSLARDTGKKTDAVTSDGTVNVSGLEPNATWQYSSDGGKVWQTGAGKSLVLTGDGEKNLLVRQTDAAGNTSPIYATLNFLLDSKADMPFLMLANDAGKKADNLTSNGTINVLGLENGASWKYSIDSGNNWTTGSGSQFALRGDGNKTVIVQQTDIADNKNLNSMVLNFTLDTHVAAPTAVLTNDTGKANTDYITRDGTFDILGLEAGATWRYSLDYGASWQSGEGDHLTLQGDGNKSILIQQTDLAGNVSLMSSPLNFLLDTQINRPILTLATDSAKITDHAANVSGIEAGASWEFSSDGIHWTTGSGNRLLVADEIKTVFVRQTDLAGNISDNVKLSFLPDVPTLTLVTDSGRENDQITNDGTIAVSNLESGFFDWQYRTNEDKTWTKGSGDKFVLTGDGIKNVIATQIDNEGNLSVNNGTLNFILDTIVLPPKLALINDSAKKNDFITNDGRITVANLEPDASWQYSFDNGATWETGIEHRLTAKEDGIKTVLVKQTDIAGNVSANTELLRFTLDSTVDLPIIKLQTDSGNKTDNVTNDGTVVVSNLEKGATWQYSTDSGTTWRSGEKDHFTLTGDGNKTVLVRQTDVAGNTNLNSATLNFTLDSQVKTPTLKLVDDTGNSKTDAIMSSGIVTVSGLEQGATWEFSEDGKRWHSGAGNTLVFKEDGKKTVFVRQTDTAGNLSETTNLSFTIDTQIQKPTLKLANDTGSNKNDAITADGSVSVSGLENDASWEFSEDGKRWQAGSGDTLVIKDDGHKTVFVRQTDVAGNLSEIASLNFTLDTQIKTPILKLANDTGNNKNDAITADGMVTVSGLENGANWEFSENGKTWILGNGNAFNVKTEGLQTVLVRQTDNAGNQKISQPFAFTLDTLAPTVSEIERDNFELPNERTAFTVQVDYADLGSGIDSKTISVGDISLLGGTKLTVAKVTLENNTAIYTVNAPKNGWQNIDVGTYQIALNANEIKDIAGNSLEPLENTKMFEILPKKVLTSPDMMAYLIETDSILDTAGKVANLSNINVQREVKGQFGSFNIDQSGNWTYVTDLPHDEFLQDKIYLDSFPISNRDSVQSNVVIQIRGTNDVPILVDDLAKQVLTETQIGNVKKNVLQGQVAVQSIRGEPITQNTDKSWNDLDETRLTFALKNSKAVGVDEAGHELVKTTLKNGSTLTLNTWDGSYNYVPSIATRSNEAIDEFEISADGASLLLSLNRFDLSDLDGISPELESQLANFATPIGEKLTGDLNGDHIEDKSQGGVVNIAWGTYQNFKDALANKLTSATSIINIVVAKEKASQIDNSAQLSHIAVLPSNSPLIGNSKPESNDALHVSWDPIMFSVSAKTDAGLIDMDPERAGLQTKVIIDISRAAESNFNAYLKYVSAKTIEFYNVAGNPLTTLDGEQLTSAKQAGWYDFTQRTENGDGARFIKAADGTIQQIEITLTDNTFGDDDPATNVLTDPSIPVIRGEIPPPIVIPEPEPEPPVVIPEPEPEPVPVIEEKTLTSAATVTALATEFQHLILQDTQIQQTVTKTELVDNPLLCLPEWTQKLLDIPAKIEQLVTTTEQVTAPLNGTGNTFDNRISGNNAANVLSGLAGKDILTGKAGADTFAYQNVSDSLSEKRDVITDFSVAQGDKIDLSALDADANQTGKQSFHYLGSGEFSKQTAQLRFDGATQQLQGDTNGDGKAEFVIELSGVTTLAADALILKPQ